MTTLLPGIQVNDAQAAAKAAERAIENAAHRPPVRVHGGWYYGGMR